MEKKNYLEVVDLNLFIKVLETFPCPKGYRWDLSIQIQECFDTYPVRVSIELHKINTNV